MRSGGFTVVWSLATSTLPQTAGVVPHPSTCAKHRAKRESIGRPTTGGCARGRWGDRTKIRPYWRPYSFDLQISLLPPSRGFVRCGLCAGGLQASGCGLPAGCRGGEAGCRGGLWRRAEELARIRRKNTRPSQKKHHACLRAEGGGASPHSQKKHQTLAEKTPDPRRKNTTPVLGLRAAELARICRKNTRPLPKKHHAWPKTKRVAPHGTTCRQPRPRPRPRP
jgi:hypothetical protein